MVLRGEINMTRFNSLIDYVAIVMKLIWTIWTATFRESIRKLVAIRITIWDQIWLLNFPKFRSCTSQNEMLHPRIWLLCTIMRTKQEKRNGTIQRRTRVNTETKEIHSTRLSAPDSRSKPTPQRKNQVKSTTFFWLLLCLRLDFV